ncbi:hypothetical protein JW964_14045 [candidate division KSB1 bacterium]|nr:hypothetical protein [candidate division KSB1 bacterium]
MKKMIIFLLMWVIIFSQFNFAKDYTRAVEYKLLRNEAMGGAGIAGAKGTFSFLYNPAFLGEKKFHLTLADVQFVFADHFIDLVNYMVDNNDDFKKLNNDYSPKLTAQQSDSLIDYLRREAVVLDNNWYQGRLIPAIGLTVGNFALGVYNTANVALLGDIGIVIPKVNIKVYNDLVFNLGYGKYFTDNLSIGTNFKMIRRFEAPVIKLQIEEMNNMQDTWEAGSEEFKQGQNGFGIDLGALYHINERLRMGVVCQDFLGQIDNQNTPMNLKIGALFQPTPELSLVGEFRDLFNYQGDNFFKKVNLGGEFRMPILRLRAGVNQGYPSIGGGIDLRFIQLNYAYIQYEAGNFPGQKDENLHMLDVQINIF